MEENKVKLNIVILTSGEIQVELAKWLNKIIGTSPFQLVLDFQYGEPIQSNRNRIVKKFLAGDCTHLIMIDDDIVPPDNLLNLIYFEKDIITPVCIAWQNGDLIPLVIRFKKDGTYYVPTELGLVEVDRATGGCLIIKRNVLEVLKKPFEIPFDEDGIAVNSEDFCFFKKAKENGFKVWAHKDYLCSHFRKINLESIYQFLQNREDNN